MPKLIRPVVSPRGRVIVLSGATLWLIAAMLLSAIPEGAVADVSRSSPVKLTAFDHIDGAPGLLYQPRVFTDVAGAVYVVDRGNARVIRLAEGPDWEHADVVFGREGAGPGEFITPRGLAADADGNMFVADNQLGRISKFSADGTFLTSVDLPFVSGLVVDSRGRVIAYPGRGEALLQRFDNSLDDEEPLLRKTDRKAQISPFAVMLAIGEDNRLYLLDQVDPRGPRMLVYDAEMRPIDGWAVEPPGLLETLEQRKAQALQRAAATGARVINIAGIQAMALDVSGGQIAFAYLMEQTSGDSTEWFTRIATYSTTGSIGWHEDRGTQVCSTAFTRNGELLESDTERIQVWGSKPLGTESDN